MKRIAVITDTHNLLHPKGIQTITVCDVIIHGDYITNQQISDQLVALCYSWQQ